MSTEELHAILGKVIKDTELRRHGHAMAVYLYLLTSTAGKPRRIKQSAIAEAANIAELGTVTRSLNYLADRGYITLEHNINRPPVISITKGVI
jgi:hypothetical protein